MGVRGVDKNMTTYTPAPNARAYVNMKMGRFGGKLPDFIGMSPLDPKLPEMIKEW